MDYDVALSWKMLKVKKKEKKSSIIVVTFRGGISKFTVIGPYTMAPIPFMNYKI